MTVLIVDDDYDDIGFIKEVMSEIDPTIKFIEANDGVSALQRLDIHSNNIKLIILDIKMPRMNGVECLQQIHKSFPNIPVILFSSVLLSRLSEEDKKGAAACIKKPSSYSDMKAAGHIFTSMLYSKS